MRVSAWAPWCFSWECGHRSAPRGESALRSLFPKYQMKPEVSDRILSFRFERETPERLDKFLVEQLQEFSRSRIQGLVADGFVDVNERAAKKAGRSEERRVGKECRSR